MVDQLIIMGPAWPLRGNLAAFDEKLATCFIASSIQTKLCTFSLQYPGFLFPGTTQYSSDPAPKQLKIEVAINSINPLNWLKVGFRIKREKPDLIIVRYWIPFMGPCLGTILRIVKWNKHTKVIAIVDNMIPHEKRLGVCHVSNPSPTKSKILLNEWFPTELAGPGNHFREINTIYFDQFICCFNLFFQKKK